MKKKILEYSLMPYTKVNTKWIKDLNKRPYTINLLEENTGRTFPEKMAAVSFLISQNNGNSNKNKHMEPN